ncbi:uncharacterized protein METZ01_LOCUS492279 [marine metagenome]|uniref:Uncharacterized protein n=1 Tax=marine metagenome TaxID=408172 RepID=A0A383D592_9ZZZZ
MNGSDDGISDAVDPLDDLTPGINIKPGNDYPGNEANIDDLE